MNQDVSKSDHPPLLSTSLIHRNNVPITKRGVGMLVTVFADVETLPATASAHKAKKTY